MIKISIVTICYNEPDLEKTCQSIVNQSCQDFEWIVIDGGSNQETLDIFKKYEYRIDKFISEHDDGRYNAMNKGINLASGDYINFLNAGDYYTDNLVLQKIIDSGLDKDIVYGNLTICDEENCTLKSYPDKISAAYFLTESLPHPASFIRKTLFEKYGKYNEELVIASDLEKWVEFIAVNNCSYKHVKINVSVFNLRGISSNDTEADKKEREYILNKFFSPEKLEEMKSSVKIKYTIPERLFSVKHTYENKHTIVTILGISLKFRNY